MNKEQRIEHRRLRRERLDKFSWRQCIELSHKANQAWWRSDPKSRRYKIWSIIVDDTRRAVSRAILRKHKPL